MTTTELGQPVLDVRNPNDIDARMWGTTTLIGVIGSEALIGWAANQAAECGVNQHQAWQAIEEAEGRNEAIRWVAGARYRPPKGQRSASELGTAVHHACEEYALTGARPKVDSEVAPFLHQFEKWLNRFQPTYTATEVVVYNERYNYAGQVDAFMELGGVSCIVDYKTTRRAFDARGEPTGPFPDVALQLAAYRHAEFAAVWRPRRSQIFRRRYYLLNPEERELAVPVPNVDAGVCIHITPEHCESYPVECDDTVFRTFLHVMQVARWQFETSRGVIGQPMIEGAHNAP